MRRAATIAVVWVIAAACESSRAGGDDAIDAAGGDDAPPIACTGKSAQPLDAVWTMTVNGVARSIRVHVPASYDPSRPTPVVLDFHGYSMNASSQEAMTRLPAKSDAAGFVSATPEGTGVPAGWNAGVCCGAAAASGIDDVGFASALIDELEARLCVDPRRVYATGFSNGGFLSHRLGCELSSRIAAIAPVSGVMGIDTCAPPRAVPVIEFHGTADAIVPYDGSVALNYRSVADTVAGWVARDGCSGAPVETFAQGDSRCDTYGGCASGAEVTLCTISGGGHVWPGGGPFPGGHITTDLSASDAEWDFFVKHPIP